MRYCVYCQRVVAPMPPRFRWGLALVLGVLTGGIGLIVYVVYWNLKKKRCPVCNGNKFKRAAPA